MAESRISDDPAPDAPTSGAPAAPSAPDAARGSHASSALHAAPATLPLPGGQAGASCVLHPLLCAEQRAPLAWFHKPDGATAPLKALGIGVRAEQMVRVPIIAFLIEHPAAGAIVVDTGFHACVAAGPSGERRRNLGPVGTIMGRGIEMRVEQTVAAQLRARGIEPAAIELVVMTHLHFDHASALADFPNATVLVSEPEWHSARGRGAPLRGYSAAQLDPRPRYRTVSFNGASATPRAGFTRTLDVLGDGSLTLAFTPGHSAGHMSLIVRLAEREALIAGDAIYTMQTLRGDARPWRSDDADVFERSLAELQAYDRAHPDALIIPGHDGAHFASLQRSYS